MDQGVHTFVAYLLCAGLVIVSAERAVPSRLIISPTSLSSPT